jgi:surfeit locus 1 family protein
LSAWAARLKGTWWAVALTLVGAGIGVQAGFWQLDRASEKRALLARFDAGSAAAANPRLVADAQAPALRYERLRLTGRYDSSHQVLLDNLSFKGQPGYQILTPLTTPGGTVLVNRGWVPADGNRTVLPDIQVGGETQDVTGRIDWLPRPGIELTAAAPPTDAPWPRRLLFPTSQQISTQLDRPLRDYQLLLDAEAADGYVRDWQPGGMGPDRHVAYAVQWFGLALTVVVIYLVLALKNGRNAA